MKFTYSSLQDIGQALVDVVCLIRDVDEVSSDRRTAHLTRHEILVEAALLRKASSADGSLSQKLMEFIVSPSDATKPKLSIVRSKHGAGGQPEQ
jgi:hypothetical protein